VTAHQKKILSIYDNRLTKNNIMKTNAFFTQFTLMKKSPLILKLFLCLGTMCSINPELSARNRSFLFNAMDTTKTIKDRTEPKISMLSSSTFLYKNLNFREDNQTYGEGPGAIVKSLILPGWGLSATSNTSRKNIYFAFTPLSYGLIIYGVAQKIQSDNLYKEYLNSTDQQAMDNDFKLANSKRQSYLNAVAGGVAIYVLQAGVTLIRGLYNDSYRERAADWRKNIAVNVTPYYDLRLQSCAVNTSISFKINKRNKTLNPLHFTSQNY
jgi:hypothetical protein